MKRLQNTLYVTAPDGWLSLEGETVVVSNKDETLGRMPLLNLEGIVCFGYRGVSPALMGACAEKGIDLCFLTPHGRFLARVNGPVHGNVLLRETQHAWSKDGEHNLQIAKMMLTGKIFNGRWCLGRMLRDHPQRIDGAAFDNAIREMQKYMAMAGEAAALDTLRGMEA